MTIRRSGMVYFHFLWRRHVQPFRELSFRLQSQFDLKDDAIGMQDPQDLLSDSSRQMDVLPFRNPTFALQSLSCLKDDPIAMRALQDLLLESSRRVDGSRLTNDETLEEVVQLIRSGELLVGRDKRWLLGGSSGTKEESQPSPAAAPPQRVARIEEPDPPTFPTNFDGVTQAALLVAAASSGVPFCAT